MVLDMSSLETVWVVIGEAGEDEPAWFVCFTTNENDAARAVSLCEREVSSLAPDERETLYDAYATSAKPELAPIIARRQAKLTLDKGYRGNVDGATYRYAMVSRWPSYGQRVEEGRRARPEGT